MREKRIEKGEREVRGMWGEQKTPGEPRFDEKQGR